MRRKWEPSGEDAISLAAFRWFANTIENAAIELYATDRTSFKEVETVLRHALSDLEGLRPRFLVSEEENGCPDGYVLCHGVCAPSCDFEDAAAKTEQRQKAGARPKRKKG